MFRYKRLTKNRRVEVSVKGLVELAGGKRGLFLPWQCSNSILLLDRGRWSRSVGWNPITEISRYRYIRCCFSGGGLDRGNTDRINFYTAGNSARRNSRRVQSTKGRLPRNASTCSEKRIVYRTVLTRRPRVSESVVTRRGINLSGTNRTPFSETRLQRLHG